LEHNRAKAKKNIEKKMRNVLKRTAVIGSIVAILTAVLGLIGYISGFGVLVSIQEDFILMAPSTSISFILLSSIVLLLPNIKWGKRNTIIGCSIALLVSIFGLLEIIGLIFDIDLNFEDLIFPSAETLGSIPVRRMSHSTAGVFFIAGLATFGLIFYRFKNIKSLKLIHWSGILGSLTMIISVIFMMAYIYGTPLLYEQGSLIPMGMPTAFGFLMLGMSIFTSSDKTSFPIRLIAQPNTYAQLLRIFFPLSIIAVLIGSLVTVLIHFFSNVNATFISALIVGLVAGFTGLVVNWVSKIIGGSIDEEQAKRKRAETSSQKALNRAEFYKDLFTHDISNILQSIRSTNHFIRNPQNKGDPQEIKELADMINEQVDRGAKLVSTVRRLSQLDEEVTPIASVDAMNYLNESVRVLKNYFQNKDIKIQINSFKEKLIIQANELLQDVFENILINAAKHNDNDVIEITIHISMHTQNDIENYKLEFKDNGIGIIDERKSTIFQRGNSMPKERGGMGLGLSLVKKIIESYNGKIWVEDRIKNDHLKGSNLIILIPKIHEPLLE